MKRRDQIQRTLRGRPPTGAALPAAERMRRMRERRRAAGLKTVVTWVTSGSNQNPYSDHRVRDARSLAMHAVIVQKIERDPRLLSIPRRNLRRWKGRWQNAAPAWLDEWQKVLQQPWPVIAALITELSENATRLRQSTPFAGVLTASERKRIYEAFRA